MSNEGSPKDALVVSTEEVIDNVVKDLRNDKNALVKGVTPSKASKYLTPIFEYTSRNLSKEVYRQAIEIFGIRKGGRRVLKAYLSSIGPYNGSVEELVDFAGDIEVWFSEDTVKNNAHNIAILYYGVFGAFPSRDELEFLIEKIPKSDWKRLISYAYRDCSDLESTASRYHLYRFYGHDNDNDDDAVVSQDDDDDQKQTLEGVIDKIDQYNDILAVA